MPKIKKDLSTVKAVFNNLKSGTRKINEILQSIRGRKVDLVLRDLQFNNKRVSKEIIKTIKSAVANAENNNQLDIDTLIIKEAASIKKHFSNLTIVVSEKKEAAQVSQGA